MGYCIEYDQGTGKNMPQKGRWTSRWLLTGVFLLLFGILVQCFWPRGSDLLEEVLWPGDKAQTIAALETMAEKLGAGISMEDAIEGFCREILDEETLALS